MKHRVDNIIKVTTNPQQERRRDGEGQASALATRAPLPGPFRQP